MNGGHRPASHPVLVHAFARTARTDLDDLRISRPSLLAQIVDERDAVLDSDRVAIDRLARLVVGLRRPLSDQERLDLGVIAAALHRLAAGGEL